MWCRVRDYEIAYIFVNNGFVNKKPARIPNCTTCIELQEGLNYQCDSWCQGDGEEEKLAMSDISSLDRYALEKGLHSWYEYQLDSEYSHASFER
jgi:hypothetical protein